MNARVATTWEAPRWAKMESFIKDQALLLGLECKTEVNKWLLRESGRVEVMGESDKCKEFCFRLNVAVNYFNNPKGAQ